MSSKPGRRKAPAGCFWRGNTLWGRIQAGGRDIKWSLRTNDPKVAAARRNAERDRAIAALHYGDHRRTFQEALESWGQRIVDTVGPRTLARYVTSLGVLQPFLEGLYLDEIDAELIRAIVTSRRETPSLPAGKKKPIIVSVATIKRDLTALSSVIDHAIDEGWIERNAVRDWLRPGGRRKSRLNERRDPIVLPDIDHVQMVIRAAAPSFGRVIEAALLTGARESELANAERSQFDRGRRQLTLIGKRNKRRTIDLVDGGQDYGLALFSSLPAAIGTRSLFWHQPVKGRGQRREKLAAIPYSQVSTNFRRVVAKVVRQAQKQEQEFRPFKLHDLRHLHAVLWLKSGRSIYVLQQRLGHTSIKTTEIYLQFLTPEEAHIAKYGPGTKTGTDAAVLKTRA